MRCPVPDAILEQHIIALGKTRSGKSSTIRQIVEEKLLKKNKPVAIVDPKGDWWGLKSSASGKSAGFSLVIFGGEHADVPINARSGASVAELIATENRPCIIDLGGWMPGDRTQFWLDFASTFFRLHRGHHWLVIDEVHNFCPKGKIMDPQAGKMLHWSNRLASEGLGKGISLIAASQRPQKVHNDFLTSCETLIALRVIHKADRDALEDWIDGCGDPEKGKELVNTIASMKRGEAWVWSPEVEFGPKRIQFPMFETYDSFKAQPGLSPKKLKGWADVDLAAVTKKLKAVVKEAEAKDPEKLRVRIRELEREIKTHAVAPVSAAKSIVQTKASKAEILAIVKQELNPWRELCEKLRRSHIHLKDDMLVAADNLRDTASKLSDLALEEAIPVPKNVLMNIVKSVQENITQPILRAPIHSVAVRPQPKFRPSPRRELKPADTDGDSTLPPGERSILIATAQYPDGVERDHLSVLTGYKRSSRDTYVNKLVSKDMVQVSGGRVLITQAGVDALGGDYEPLPQGEELQRYWLAKLPIGEKKILQILLDAAGNPVARDSLDEATGYKRSSRDTYINKMIARRIVEVCGQGQIKASGNLF